MNSRLPIVLLIVIAACKSREHRVEQSRGAVVATPTPPSVDVQACDGGEVVVCLDLALLYEDRLTVRTVAATTM